MYSICFTIAGVIFSILLFIIYSFKTNFSISENKIYHSIIITTIITGLIEIYAFILVRNNIPENSNLYLFALKFLFLGFVTWLYLFTLYTVIVTLKLKDKDNDKCRIILVISSIIFTILSIITITLPISINKVGDLLLPTGSGVEVIYLLAVLCFVIMIIAITGPIRSLIFLDVSSGIVNSFFNNRFIISDVNSMMYSIMLVKKRSTKKVRNVFLMFFSSDVFLLNMVYTRLYDQGFFMSYISMCEFIT